MRGIPEGMDRPEDNLCIVYSVNKEDIWIAHIPVPICGQETQEELHEDLSLPKTVDFWNLYSPKWARAEQTETGLRMCDSDPVDYCRAERLLPLSSHCSISLTLTPEQADHGCLYGELCTPEGASAVRFIFREDGKLYLRTTTEVPVAEYKSGTPVTLTLEADCTTFFFTLAINGEPLREPDGTIKQFHFMRAANQLSRLVLRTGPYLHTPTLDMDPEVLPENILPDSDEPVKEAAYVIHRLDFSNIAQEK